MTKGTRAKPAAPEMHDLSGRQIGDYHLLRKLGQGGMGQVYLAEQLALKRKVALKVLRPDLAANATALARFKLEAEAVARATHANIVQVYDYGEDAGVWYMALEYVEGRTLKDFINKKGPPELLIALSIMRQVASALQRAAELGITHRDIKPENILLTRKGEVKVADFGLSRHLSDEEKPKLNLTQTGVTMGTPLYMAPEQVEGKEVDPRTDIYAFGVTCYHMLCGEPPFRGDTAFEVALAHVQREPEPLKNLRPDLPDGLCAIVHKMLAKAPEHRYQTARELSRDIIRLRESLNGVSTSVSAMPSIQVDAGLLNTIIPPDQSVMPSGKGSATAITAPPPPLPPPPPKTRWGLLAGSVVLSMLIALSGGVAWGLGERASQGPMPYGDDSIRPADAQVTDRVPKPSTHVKKLEEKVQPFLDSSKGQNPGPGLSVCMELGLFYLDNGRLDDAATLFQRVEKMNTREFKGFGQIGRAVVLAMQHKPRESNALFTSVFTTFNPKKPPIGKVPIVLPGGMGKAADRRVEEIQKPIKAVLSYPRWQYYLARARYLNRQNGLKDDDMPPLFVMRAQDVELPRRN